MRRIVLLFSCILMVIFSVDVIAQNEKTQERQRERRSPPSGEKARPRERSQEQPRQKQPERRPPAERQRTPPPQSEPRTGPRQPAPRERAMPRPPQRYDRNQRGYQRQYHYNGRWSYQPPRPYQNRYRYGRSWRVFICQPGYVIFVGYDYRNGQPVFQFYRGHCNVPRHYHGRDFYDGYR